MQWIRGAAFVACAFGLAACADLTSINRRSTLPSSTTVDGRAIHLDAKQRVVLAKAGKTGANGAPNTPDMACAEPSPDALSAFASSMSGGISVSGQGAGSAAQALSEAAGSIGLRTQSITLMRDALYRVCEAYYNGQLSPPQVMALMARSQDLTAAVVSVEQLTGAVVAKQAALGGSSGASASATMLSNTEALTKLRELEKQYKDEVTKLTTERDEAVKTRKTKSGELDATIAKIKVTTAAEELKTLEATRIQQEEALETATGAERSVQERLDLKQQQLNDVTKARTAIEGQLDSSATSASANAASNATLQGGSVASTIDKDTAKAVSDAVISITNSVINKNYVIADCMAVLTTPQPNLDPLAGPALQSTCLVAIQEHMRAEAEAAKAAAAKAKAEAAKSQAVAAQWEAATAQAQAKKMQAESTMQNQPLELQPEQPQ